MSEPSDDLEILGLISTQYADGFQVAPFAAARTTTWASITS
jgi:hypothetical protein